MEHLNRVHLRGVVGSSTMQMLNGKKMCRFSVATERAYRDPMGEAKIDTTWHNVQAWEGGRHIPDLGQIRKGSRVELHGRIRNSKFEGSDGTSHFYSDIQVSDLKLLDQDTDFVVEM